MYSKRLGEGGLRINKVQEGVEAEEDTGPNKKKVIVKKKIMVNEMGLNYE